MTEPDNGVAFSLIGMDSNSKEYLSNYNRNGYFKYNEYWWYGQLYFPLMFISDNEGCREFATIYINEYLNIYTVPLNPDIHSSFTLSSSTAIPFLYTKFGIKRVSDSLYYIYDGYSDIISSPHQVVFRKISVTPGVGYSIDILGTFSIADDSLLSEQWKVEDIQVIERRGYITIMKTWDTIVPPYYPGHIEIFIYSVDMDTDIASGGSVYTTPSDKSCILMESEWQNWGKSLVLQSSLGELEWLLYYVESPRKSSWGGFYYYGNATHVVINGIDHTTWQTDRDYNIRCAGWDGENLDDYEGGLHQYTNHRIQYNYKDYFCMMYFYIIGFPELVHVAKISDGSVTTTFAPNPDDIIGWCYSPFISHSAFPAISNYLTGFKVVDPATGLLLGDLTIPGVTQVYGVFPNLDTTDDSMYVSAKMDNGLIKLLAINPTTFQINREYCIKIRLNSIYSWLYSFSNLGNFFIWWQWWGAGYGVTGIDLNVAYLIKLKSNLAMILEMN